MSSATETDTNQACLNNYGWQVLTEVDVIDNGWISATDAALFSRSPATQAWVSVIDPDFFCGFGEHVGKCSFG